MLDFENLPPFTIEAPPAGPENRTPTPLGHEKTKKQTLTSAQDKQTKDARRVAKRKGKNETETMRNVLAQQDIAGAINYLEGLPPVAKEELLKGETRPEVLAWFGR